MCLGAALALSSLLHAHSAHACRSETPEGCDAWARSNVIGFSSVIAAPLAIPSVILGSVVTGFAVGGGPISRPLVLATLAYSTLTSAANAGVLLAAAINGDPPGVLFYSGPALVLSAAAMGVSAWALRFRTAPVVLAPTVAGDRVMVTLGARF